VASVLVQPLHNVYLTTYTSTLMIEFMMGVAAGYLVMVRGVPFVIPCLVLGIAGLVGADIWYPSFNAAHNANEYFHFLTIGAPMALLFLGVVGLETQYRLRVPGWVVIIGNASYSLYLWHAPLTVFVGRVSARYQLLLHNGYAHAAWLAFVFVFVIGGSIALYYAVERPLLRMFSRHLPPMPATVRMRPAPER
jgi:exopolysaccharide production protein ExoZ